MDGAERSPGAERPPLDGAPPADVAGWSAGRAPHVTFAGPALHYGIGLEGHLEGLRDRLPGRDAGRRTSGTRRHPQFWPSATGTPTVTARPGSSSRPRALDWLRGEGGARLVAAAAARLQDVAPSRVVVRTGRLAAAVCPAALGRRWENKIAFRQRAELRSASGSRPAGSWAARTWITTLSAAAYGSRLVVQAPYGYAGMQSHLRGRPRGDGRGAGRGPQPELAGDSGTSTACRCP
ncbi:MAG: hypothetical protein U0470_14780 [Anaerolineae bacterium]